MSLVTAASRSQYILVPLLRRSEKSSQTTTSKVNRFFLLRCASGKKSSLCTSCIAHELHRHFTKTFEDRHLGTPTSPSINSGHLSTARQQLDRLLILQLYCLTDDCPLVHSWIRPESLLLAYSRLRPIRTRLAIVNEINRKHWTTLQISISFRTDLVPAHLT